MKKVLTSFIVTLTLLTTTTYSQNADAIVGLIFKNKIVKTIGAAGAISGGVLGVASYVTASNTVQIGVAFTGAMFSALGIIIAGVGLVILDDGQLADIEFRTIDPNTPADYIGFTKEEVLTYNSELEMLNSIRQTIVSEVSDSDDTADAEALWHEYSDEISPETFELAQAKAKIFVEKL